MKKLLGFWAVIGVFCLFSFNSNAQGDSLELKKYDSLINTVDDKMIVSWKTFHPFINNTLSTYMVGKQDQHLFKNYFVLDQSDDQLKFGVNFANPSTRHIMRLGGYAPFAKKQATLYNEKNLKSPTDSRLGNDIGVSLKYSFVLDKGIYYYTSKGKNAQIAKLSGTKKTYIIVDQKKYRDSIFNIYDKGLRLEFKNRYDSFKTFEQRIIADKVLLNQLSFDDNGLSDSAKKHLLQSNKSALTFYAPYRYGLIIAKANSQEELEKIKNKVIDEIEFTLDQAPKRREKFIKDADKKAIARFTKKEAKYLTDPKHSTGNYMTWFSLDANLPITRTKLKTGTEKDSNYHDTTQFPFKANASINYAVETKRFKFYAFATYGLQYSNSATTGILSASQLYTSTPITNSLRILDEDAKVYFGDFSMFWTSSLTFDIVLFPKCNFSLNGKKRKLEGIGGHFQYVKYFGSSYSPVNYSVGLPFNLKDKEGKLTVNFEVLGVVNDINNTLSPEVKKTWQEKLTVGVKVGLPFGQAIYK